VEGDGIDCGDLTVTDIQVLGVDVYNLDADADGIGCESAATSPTSSNPATTTGSLPRTGQDTRDLVVIGSLLLAGGAALLLARHRVARA